MPEVAFEPPPPPPLGVEKPECGFANEKAPCAADDDGNDLDGDHSAFAPANEEEAEEEEDDEAAAAPEGKSMGDGSAL